MIREKKKKSKYSYKKTKAQVIGEYLRTIIISIVIAGLITLGLTIHTRNEIISNLYDSTSQQTMDLAHAKELIEQSIHIEELARKNYSVCLHAGELFEIAGELDKAQYAYELAVEKVKIGVLKPYYKLFCVLVAKEDFEKANALLENIEDANNKQVIKFKTRTYIVMGDKYYSIGKFLSAAKCYEKAEFYYDKFAKKDKVVEESIKTRIINAYIQTADVMVKSGLNSDAVRFLKVAEKYDPKNQKIKYKLAIIYTDLDPEIAVEYLEGLLHEIPQEIDYNIYGTALMKAAYIADLDGRPTKAKYYRYKIHSIDMFVNRKVVYKNDIETIIDSFSIKKIFFKYPININFRFSNISNVDIINLWADFVLMEQDKILETISLPIANRNNPLYSNGSTSDVIPVKFKKKALTKKELANYEISIYLYKDEKYKTQVARVKIPTQKAKTFEELYLQ